MNGYFKKQALVMAATAALSVSMTTGALALENSAAQYVASAVESVASSQDLNDITRRLALFYNATAETSIPPRN